ncbi:MAG: DUF5672 family protein [Chitinophagaceae bacterium]
MSNSIVIIPVYKSDLTPAESFSLQQCTRILGNHEIRLIAPDGLEIDRTFSHLPVTRFAGRSFASLQGYNELMLSPAFYAAFLDYEYILIHQLDALVFRDELNYWCNLGFDYYGAPWVRKEWSGKYFNLFGLLKQKVGNGGFCLRKTATFYKMAKRISPIAPYIRFGEDIFWCNYGRLFNRKFRILDENSARRFAFEEEPRQLWEINANQLPFGCHAFEKNDPLFWKEQLPDLPLTF